MAAARVELEGNLGRKPELRYTSNGKPVLGFSIYQANWRRINDEFVDDGGFWMDISYFARNEDEAKNYAALLDKGMAIAVDGRMLEQRWNDKDGNEQKKLVCIADNIYLKANFVKQVVYHERQQPQQQPQQQQQQSDESFDGDMPF